MIRAIIWAVVRGTLTPVVLATTVELGALALLVIRVTLDRLILDVVLTVLEVLTGTPVAEATAVSNLLTVMLAAKELASRHVRIKRTGNFAILQKISNI